MSKRLYFDCPIQAAYMAKEFGVKFCRYMDDDEPCIETITIKTTEGGKSNTLIEEYYIYESYDDWEDVFNVIKSYENVYVHPLSYDIFDNVTIVGSDGEPEASFKDGKFLFMPKEEV